MTSNRFTRFHLRGIILDTPLWLKGYPLPFGANLPSRFVAIILNQCQRLPTSTAALSTGIALARRYSHKRDRRICDLFRSGCLTGNWIPMCKSPSVA